MVIRRSVAADVKQLVGDLGAAGPNADTRREAAVARLGVIGARAAGHLIARFPAADSAAERLAILRALETIRDDRALDVAFAAFEHEDADTRAGGAGLAGALLDGARGTDALDRLTAAALDANQPVAVRLAALQGLARLPARTLAPLAARLEDDPDQRLKAALARGAADSATGARASLEAMAAGDLPADPERVLLLVHEEAARTPLATLHRLVAALRAREAAETRPARRSPWTMARGAVHLALARRNSRVALYDLRETIEASEPPLPDSFVEAVALVGEASCLEAVAAAWTKAAAAPAWRASLAGAAASVATRERLTRRHSAVKRIRIRWGPAVAELVDAISRPSRSARAPRPASRT